MKELDRALLQQLSRLQAPECPSTFALGEFLDEKSGAEKRQEIENHLRGCPSCINRLVELRELLHLETQGEPPPASLVTELQRLSPERASAQPQTATMLEQLSAAATGVLRTVWQWTSPRFIGEVVAASAVAVFFFFIMPTLWRQHTSGPQPNGGQTITAPDLGAQEKTLLASLAQTSAGSKAFSQKLAAALEGLPKNLLLEETRGATNVEVYKKAAPATVLVVTDKALGSGAVISPQGEVLTNWHVIQGAGQIAVVFKPQRGVEIKKELAFAAGLIKVDQIADLALLKILTPLQHVPVLSLGDMANVEVGQDVHAIGHPEGEVWTYTTGIVSQVRPKYQWKGADGLLHQSEVIQTQTALNPGNSGGPLLNDRGEIIGVNSFRGEGEGLNYAVAVDVVKDFLQQVRAASVPTPSPSRAASYRTESYGPNIMGVYVNAAVPPPDAWFFRNSAGKVAIAQGSKDTTRLDTVIQEVPGSKTVAHYFDLDCDGKIDLIGYDANQDDTLDRYDLPQEPLTITDLTKELGEALQKSIVPYPQIRVCQ